MNILNKLICLLLGHEWKPISELYGKLDNGKPIYKKYYGDCERCQKKQ